MSSGKMKFYAIDRRGNLVEFITLDNARNSSSYLYFSESIREIPNFGFFNTHSEYIFYDGITKETEINIFNWIFKDFKTVMSGYWKTTLSFTAIDPSGVIRNKEFNYFFRDKIEFIDFIKSLDTHRSWREIDMQSEINALKSRIDELQNKISEFRNE